MPSPPQIGQPACSPQQSHAPERGRQRDVAGDELVVAGGPRLLVEDEAGQPAPEGHGDPLGRCLALERLLGRDAIDDLGEDPFGDGEVLAEPPPEQCGEIHVGSPQASPASVRSSFSLPMSAAYRASAHARGAAGSARSAPSASIR